MALPKTSEKSVSLDREEHFHKGNVGAKLVVPYYYDANTDSLSPAGRPLTERYDYDDSTTIYTATAPVGTSDGSTGWTITKYDLTDSNDASGKIATDVSWTDRATGTYA